MSELSTFEKKLAERRAKKQAEQPKVHPPIVFDEDLIPDQPFEQSDEDKEMDRVIASIDIIDGYVRWCGKMTPDVKKGQRESIMISCPTPGHRDKVPSAWINLDKQTWFCGGCQIGGDVHDIAAYHFGFPVPAYKDGARFHELRREMAKDFGFTFTSLPGGTTIITPPVSDDDDDEVDSAPAGRIETRSPGPGSSDPTGDVKSSVGSDVDSDISDSDTSAADSEKAEPDVGAAVIDLFDDMDDISYPPLDWRKIVPEDTFLMEYMKACVQDDVAEEYHFWNGLLALGFALGRDVRLDDLVPVYGNLFICALGHSGSGKSKARYHLNTLLETALPHDWSDPNSKGVRKIATPASAEVLIYSFQKPVTDPSDPKKVLYYAPVRGLVDFNELSQLVGRTNRMGNVMKPTLMQFYDMENVISTSSMSSGVKEAHEPFASALTTTQPKALKDLIGKSDDASGFLNRWVFAAGPEKERFAVGGVRIDVTPAVRPLQDVAGWAGTFHAKENVTWSMEAVLKFTEFFHDRIEPDKKKAETALITRIDLLLKKMILLFSANKQEKVVTRETIDQVLFCYDYILGCYGISERELGSTLASEVSEAIMNQARKQYEINKKGVTLNQIARALARRKYPNDLLLKTADALVKLGFLSLETPKPGAVGRPTVRYKYVV